MKRNMRTDRLERFLRMIYLIQSTDRGVSLKYLADLLGVSDKTLMRDIDVLSCLFPVRVEERRVFFDGDFGLYPTNLTDEERQGFLSLLGVARQQMGTLPPAWQTAYEKVVAAITKEQKDARRLWQKIGEHIAMGRSVANPEQPNFLPELIRAISEQKTIHIRYHTQSRNQETERDLDPYYLLPRENRFYVIGFCHLTSSYRTFRLSRFLWMRVKEDTRFEIRPDFDLHQFFKYTWSIDRREERIRFVVRFSPEVARYVKEEELQVRPMITDLPDGSIRFEVTVDGDQEFLRWLRQYGPHAEIIRPKKYRDRMLEEAKQLMKMYEKDLWAPQESETSAKG